MRTKEERNGEVIVEVRLVQQNRVQVLKRYSVGGWSHREPGEPIEPVALPIRLCHQWAASILIGSSAEEKPSHLLWPESSQW